MANLNVPLYDPRLVQPMREELTRIGFQELRTPAEVDAVLPTSKDTTLVVVNSVCGCAARNARPAAPSTMWRRHPFITSESCVHRRTRFRGTLFSHNWAMGGSAYSSRTVTLRDRYSSGLMSTRLYLSSMDSRPAPG